MADRNTNLGPSSEAPTIPISGPSRSSNNGRALGRGGNGRGNGRGRVRQTQDRGTARGTRLAPQGPALKLIKLDHLRADDLDLVQIMNYKFIASYNWSNSKAPTIFVPGGPALWSPPALPIQIPSDPEPDHQATPVSSFLPFFASLNIMQPNYSLQPISLVTDRNSLRKLFDIVKSPRASWRIEVEIVDETMFFTRWELNDWNIVGGSGNSGYGHSFEQKFSKFAPGLEGSVGHHRIVEYELGGLKCLVRFEADGYLGDDQSTTGINELLNLGEESSSTADVDGGASLQNSLQALSFNDNSPSAKELRVMRRGHLVSPEAILEVKCKKRINLGDHKVQCWISQTKHLYIGQHQDGLVEKIKEYQLGYQTMKHEDALTQVEPNQDALKKMIALIKEIKIAVWGIEGKKGCIVFDHKEKPAVLRVYKSTDKRLMISDEVKERYWGRRKE